ncbi:unnamed protein product [Porites evermanni]|uniref:Uncharacterized protein n=1 Tax=Porites evermanni TaxID=104178 RepID=A0ABN8MBT5_9CNID|nr:unnamed protein product [Porites evermanni]
MGKNCWLVPPVYLIPRVLVHFLNCKSRGVLVVPFWPYLIQGNGAYKSFVVDFLFVQNGRDVFVHGANKETSLSTFRGRFTDPELSRLASSLSLRCLGAKVDSTTERYSRAFENNSSYSALEAAVYGIRWAHDLFGLSNPCDSDLVKGILESAKRSLSRPIVKKETLTEICIS